LYSGSRNGIVKVWQSQNHDLKLMSSLEGNAQHGSINTICRVNPGDGSQAFACGSSDKSIRIYRITDQQASLEGNQNVEMVDEAFSAAQPTSNFTASQLG